MPVNMPWKRAHGANISACEIKSPVIKVAFALISGTCELIFTDNVNIDY